jgi:hypothetical protein
MHGVKSLVESRREWAECCWSGLFVVPIFFPEEFCAKVQFLGISFTRFMTEGQPWDLLVHDLPLSVEAPLLYLVYSNENVA